MRRRSTGIDAETTRNDKGYQSQVLLDHRLEISTIEEHEIHFLVESQTVETIDRAVDQSICNEIDFSLILLLFRRAPNPGSSSLLGPVVTNEVG